MTNDAVAASDVGRIPETVRVGDSTLQAWPDAQPIRMFGEARIVLTQFADVDLYHAPLRAAALAALDDPRFRDSANFPARWTCGRKVRRLAQWAVPAAALVDARAHAFAHRVTGNGPVYLSDAWGSIYYEGDYCMAHSHVCSDISIVYLLDPGDPEPHDPTAGRLAFLDPRIDWCCPHEPQRPTRPVIPEMVPGTMVAFVSELLHSVNPYRGQRPRITLSWNFTTERRLGPTQVAPLTPTAGLIDPAWRQRP